MLSLADHILDIAENSIRAGANLVEISIIEDAVSNMLSLTIKDDGHGMSEDLQKKVLDPFYTTKTVRRVGLGLPLLKEAAFRAGGTFQLNSLENQGTTVTATFGLHHLDRQPLGAIKSTIIILIISNSQVDFFYKHRHNDRRFEIDTRQIRKHIEDVPISHPEIIKYIRGAIEEGLGEIGSEA
ncbi:MAG: ATP-binding protein [Smithellaceae bacterium]